MTNQVPGLRVEELNFYFQVSNIIVEAVNYYLANPDQNLIINNTLFELQESLILFNNSILMDVVLISKNTEWHQQKLQLYLQHFINFINYLKQIAYQ